LLDPGPSMYSCMTILSDGRVGILYEAKNTLVFARFPLSWMVENQELSLALPFSGHMVLQSRAKTTVWGRACPKAEVAVSFASQVKKTRANDHGEWRVKLDPLAVSDAPQELCVSSGRQEVVCRDVLVGEVWLCAGQSNMEWPLAAEAHADRETPLANRPGIRLLNFTYAGQGYFAKPFDDAVLARLTPDEFYEGRWRKCTPRSASKLSAVGYYFAKELDDAVDPPIGVINLAVGGSPAEAWIRRDALAAAAELSAMLKGDWLENDALDSWCRRRGVENLGDALAADQYLATDDSGPNHPFKPGFLWDAGIAELAPFPIRGVLWYQGESNAPERWRIPQHERLFRLLVDDWRQQWGRGDFPFLFCQLSSIGTEQGYQSHYWPEFSRQPAPHAADHSQRRHGGDQRLGASNRCSSTK
jgi:sialate O-acetylesterase